MESCRLEGDNRILDTMGMTITEKLVARDDTARAITYGIVDGVPVESHEAVSYTHLFRGPSRGARRPDRVAPTAMARVWGRNVRPVTTGL